MVRSLIRAHRFFDKWDIEIKDFCQTKITIICKGTERAVEVRSGDASVSLSLFACERASGASADMCIRVVFLSGKEYKN